MQASSRCRYAPRPGARPVLSTAAEPSAVRTMRTSVRLPASSRQATQVRTGSWRAFAISLRVGIAGLDVDAKTSQLGGEARVLPVSPDGERELRTRHQDRGRSSRAVDGGGLHLRRPQRGGHEGLGVVGPGHDVDVLAGELAEDCPVANALGSYAGTNRIQPRLAG